MKHARYRSWLLGIGVLSLLLSTPVFAISPSYIMFYGSQLAAPIVLQVDYTMATGFLWETRARRDGAIARETLSQRLSGRPYMNFAVFWGRWPDGPLKPEEASQHGRLYLPTATEPAAVVATFPAMEAEDRNMTRPSAQPIPVDLADHGHQIGFVAGWTLTPEEIETAKRLGIPRLEARR